MNMDTLEKSVGWLESPFKDKYGHWWSFLQMLFAEYT